MAELETGHLTEEQLLWLYYGEETAPEAGGHLAQCRQCAAEYEALKSAMASIDALPVPERPADYGDRVWSALVVREPSLARRPVWRMPRLAWAAALAALLLTAFFAGRFTRSSSALPDWAAAPAEARERLLAAALTEHLEQSGRLLLELDNGGVATARAEDLLAANRLYRQTAAQEGQATLTAVLEDLERVLLDLAHAPPSQLQEIRTRVDDQGLAFKVRVLELRLRELENRPLPRRAVPSNSSMKG